MNLPFLKFDILYGRFVKRPYEETEILNSAYGI